MNLQQLKDNFNKYLHLEDDEVIDIVMATVVSTKLKLLDNPLWIFLVAPPGASKTEILRVLSDGCIYTISTLTPNSLISGLYRKKQTDLLPLLDEKLLVIKDFTTILSGHRDDRGEIFSQLRECYDGYFEKSFGSGVGKKGYSSRFTLIAGVTPTVDKYSSLTHAMGERFLKVRIQGNEKKSIGKAFKTQGLHSKRRVLKAAVREFLDDVTRDIKIDGKIEERLSKQVEISEDIEQKCCSLAYVTAFLRTEVERDHRHIVIYDPKGEYGTRLVCQFKKMLQCLAIVREKNKVGEEEYNTLKRIAEDTLLEKRLKTVKVLDTFNLEVGTKVICNLTNYPSSTQREILQDLLLLNIMDKNRDVDYDLWSLDVEFKADLSFSGLLDRQKTEE